MFVDVGLLGSRGLEAFADVSGAFKAQFGLIRRSLGAFTILRLT